MSVEFGTTLNMVETVLFKIKYLRAKKGKEHEAYCGSSVLFKTMYMWFKHFSSRILNTSMWKICQSNWYVSHWKSSWTFNWRQSIHMWRGSIHNGQSIISTRPLKVRRLTARWVQHHMTRVKYRNESYQFFNRIPNLKLKYSDRRKFVTCANSETACVDSL